MKVAVIGAGFAAQPHILSLADLAGEVEFAWLYGRTPERLATAAKTFALPTSTRRTTRLDDIWQDRDVRAVLVLTPPNAHLDVVRQAAEAGKHVLLEKPLEVDMPRAMQVVELCERLGVKLAVMFQHRLREPVSTLRQMIRSGELGTLISVQASARWWRPQSYYDVPGRGTMARDGGGVLMVQGIHTLDLLISLVGMPKRVTALTATSPVHTMETEDTVCALLQFGSGAIGTIDATTAGYPGFPEEIALNFTGGTATLEGGAVTGELMDGRKFSFGEKQSTGFGANIMAFDHDAHRAVIADFIGSVKTGREPAVSGRSALDAQRLIDAVIGSARMGRAVEL
jgi:UDP-N-acetyl-2-amino-2-deoxyglucuronate dehydrogenase